MDGFVGLRKKMKMWTHNDGVKKVRQEGTVVKIRPAIVSDREQNPCDNSTDNEKGLQEQKMERTIKLWRQNNQNVKGFLCRVKSVLGIV